MMRARGETTVSFAEDAVAFVGVPSEVASFDGGDDWRVLYDRELTDLLNREVGAKEVVIFDHTVRVDDPDAMRKARAQCAQRLQRRWRKAASGRHSRSGEGKRMEPWSLWLHQCLAPGGPSYQQRAFRLRSAFKSKGGRLGFARSHLSGPDRPDHGACRQSAA